MSNNDNGRILRQASNKWRSREMSNQFLGIGGTSELQAVFDSGYIGDDGIKNKNLRIKAFEADIIIDTPNGSTNIISNNDIVLNSVNETNIYSKNDINLTTDKNLSINTKIDYIENIGNKKTSTMKEKLEKVLNNYIVDVNNDYKVTVNQNYILTSDHDIELNAQNYVANTSNSYNVNSDASINLSGNSRTKLYSLNEILLESNDLINIKGKDINLNGNNNVNINSKKLIAHIDELYDVNITNEGYLTVTDSYTESIGNKLSINSKNTDISTTEEFTLSAGTKAIIHAIEELLLKSKKVVIESTDSFSIVTEGDLGLTGKNIINTASNDITNTAANNINNSASKSIINNATTSITNTSATISNTASNDYSINTNTFNVTAGGLSKITTNGFTVDSNNKGPITLSAGNQPINLNATTVNLTGCTKLVIGNCTLTVGTYQNRPCLITNMDIKAEKVWNAVYN